MGIETTVAGQDLSVHVLSFIACEIDAEVSDVFGFTIALAEDVGHEDVLQHIGDAGFVLGCDDKTRTHAVTADAAGTVHSCHILGELVDAGLCTCICDGTEVTAAACH